MNKQLLLFIGPVQSRSGYGSHARDIVRSLIKLDKFDIKIIPIRWGVTPLNALKPGQDNDILSRILVNPILNKKPDISVQLTVPNEFTNNNANFNIGITAGVETTVCSPEWIDGLNRVDLIIVPSKFTKSVFTSTIYSNKQTSNELKAIKPIEVLFEGVDTRTYKKTDVIEKSISAKLKDIPEDFLFLFVGHWLNGGLGHDRKDVGMLIKVFCETFKNKKDMPALLLKTGSVFSKIEEKEYINRINSIKAQCKGNLPNVYLIYGDLTNSEMNSLYNHSKVKAHVSFTKGEGFGRPLLEASISQKPVLASGFSGQMDFLDKEGAVILPGDLRNVDKSAVWDKVIIPESKWFYVNYTIASNEMLNVFKNYEQYLNGAEHLGKKNFETFTMDKMTEKLGNILDKYLASQPKQQDFVLPKLPKLKKVKNKEEK